MARSNNDMSAARAAGVDGIYLFNSFVGTDEPHSTLLNETENTATLQSKNALFCPEYRSRTATGPDTWLADGSSFYTSVPSVTPEHPKTVAPAQTASVDIQAPAPAGPGSDARHPVTARSRYISCIYAEGSGMYMRSMYHFTRPPGRVAGRSRLDPAISIVRPIVSCAHAISSNIGGFAAEWLGNDLRNTLCCVAVWTVFG